jgi:hypothetical protein
MPVPPSGAALHNEYAILRKVGMGACIKTTWWKGESCVTRVRDEVNPLRRSSTLWVLVVRWISIRSRSLQLIQSMTECAGLGLFYGFDTLE